MKNNEVLSAWTEHLDATADPYMVAFYAPYGDGNTSAITCTVF